MDKKDFSKLSQNNYFPQDIDIYEFMDKVRFYKYVLEKRALPRNIDFSVLWRKKIFSKLSQNNSIFLEILILRPYGQNTIFSICSLKT